MSAPSPLTTAFLTEWRKGLMKKPVAIVRIALTVPGSQTFDVGTRPTFAGGLNAQGILLEHGPIECAGSFMSAGVDPVSTWFTLPSQARFSWQASGKRVINAFIDFQWKGAAVTSYLVLETAVDTPQVFSGIVDEVEIGRDVIRVSCLQPRLPSRMVATSLVDRAGYPRAPEPSIGAVKPVIYGDCASQPMRGDWNRENRTAKRQAYDIYGGMIAGSKAIIVDPGMGTGSTNPKGKILIAGHTLQNVIEDSNLGSMGIRGASGAGDRLSLLDVPGGDVINTSTEAAANLDDANAFGYVVIPARSMLTPANPADARGIQLADVNEYSFTRLDYDATKRAATYQCSAIEPLGEIIDAGIAIGWKTSANVDCLQQVVLFSNSSASGKTFNQATGLTGSTTPNAGISLTGGIGTYFNATELASWDFSRGEIQCSFSGVATGRQFDIYFVGLVVKYRPKQRVLKVERIEKKLRDSLKEQGRKWTASRLRNSNLSFVAEVPTREIEGEYFAQPRGYKDDGSGTYTGVANALIERAPDLARHLLITYGGVSSGNIETGGSVHGSMVDARAKLKTWTNEDMRFGRAIQDTSAVVDLLLELAGQSLSWFFTNRFTGKYVWIPWESAPVRSYDYLVTPKELTQDLEVDYISSNEILTAIRISYLSDAYRGRMVADCAANYVGSQAGYPFLDNRDEYLTVLTGVNDKLEFDGSATGKIATLTGGTYTPRTLCTEVVTRMNSADAGGAYVCHYVPQVVSTGAANQILIINDGSNRTVTITASDYLTCEALAAALQTALNAVSSGWTATFNRTTRKYTITKSSGTAQLLWNNVNTNCAGLFGFDNTANDTGSLTYTSDWDTEEQRFVLERLQNNFVLNWESGTNGLNGNRINAADLLGFLTLRNQSGRSSYLGMSPKGVREQTLSTAKTSFGGKREVALEAAWIRDGYTARELRNRIIALGTTPLMIIKFAAHTVADLERGRVIELSTDFDADYPCPKQGGSGSWSGKLFWVVGVRQHMGPARWDTEVVAVEAV